MRDRVVRGCRSALAGSAGVTGRAAVICATFLAAVPGALAEEPSGEEAPASGGAVDEASGGEAPEVIDVVVTGTRRAVPSEGSPVRTLVAHRAALERRGARDLADAVQLLPGVRVENNCQSCGFTQIRLNGLEGPYTQVLIDGLPSYSPLTGVYGLEQLPSEMIERIEVVKGGGSALYGPGAIAGVVNVITRRPARDHASMLVQHDGIGLSTSGLRAAAQGGTVSSDGSRGFHGFATTYQRGAYDRDGDGYSELVRLRSLAGGGSLYLTVARGAELQLGATALSERRRGGNALDLPPHDAEIAEEVATRRIQGDIRFRHTIDSDLHYELGYAVAHADRDSYYGGGGQSARATLERLGPPRSDWSEDLFRRYEEARAARELALNAYGRTSNTLHVADAHLDVRAGGDHVITLGLQGQADRVEDRHLGYQRVIDDTFWYAGPYAQHHWDFASWGESLVGLRLDKHSELESPVPSPRAALLFRPLSWLRLRSAFATGFRAPQAFDEDLHLASVAGAPRIIENAPDLGPEHGMSVSQQVEAVFSPAGGFRPRASVNGYYLRLRDAFALDTRDDPATPEIEVLRVNRGATQIYGVEMEAQLSYRDLTAIRAGVTLENARNDEPDPDFGRRRIFRTPRGYGFLEGLVTIEGVELQASLEITGPMIVPHYRADGEPRVAEIDDETPWFFDVGANIAYRVSFVRGMFLRPFIGIRNLFDSYQRDFDRGPTRDVGYVYGPRFPRTLRSGLEGGF